MTRRNGPIFVVGVGRSGSTVFADVVAGHPELAWLTRMVDVWPEKLGYHRAVLSMVQMPVVGPVLRRWVHPAEGYPFWDAHYGGFSRPFRDLRASDVTARARDGLRDAVKGVGALRRRRPLFKITGWPRIGFLREVFPEAVFVHLVRDGRAVANSMLNVWFWRGWRGPENWRWGLLEGEHREKWERHGRSFVALAGLQWVILMEAFEKASAELTAEGGGGDSDRLIEVRYEDFCDDPGRTLTSFCEATGLSRDAALERDVRRLRPQSRNEKWREDLTPAQQDELFEVQKDVLERYGYLP